MDDLIRKTGSVRNIQRTNHVQSFIEEGEEHLQARAEYQERIKQLEAVQASGNQLLMDGQQTTGDAEDSNDSDEF